MPFVEPQYLHTLKTISSKKVEIESEKMMTLNKHIDEANTSLGTLVQYRNDYLKRLAHELEVGLSSKNYINYQTFLQKLEDAIVSQERQVTKLMNDLKVQRVIWLESQRKKMSYDVLSDQSEQQYKKVEARKDQKLMDEFAMRSSRFTR